MMLNRTDVAIIDDDLAVLDSLKFMLETIGYSVVAYQSAAEFLDDHRSLPACLILDHHMPHLTGLDLADRLRSDGNGIPILLITGALSANIAARAERLGIEVMEKPTDEGRLLRFVAQWS